jgi:hypothetical protein
METVETVPAMSLWVATGLKPGVNEKEYFEPKHEQTSLR